MGKSLAVKYSNQAPRRRAHCGIIGSNLSLAPYFRSLAGEANFFDRIRFSDNPVLLSSISEVRERGDVKAFRRVEGERMIGSKLGLCLPWREDAGLR